MAQACELRISKPSPPPSPLLRRQKGRPNRSPLVRPARNAYRLKPSLSQKWGQHRCDRQGKGTSVRPGSRSGAKTRDGSPGDLRDPIGVHVSEPELRVAGIQDPGPGGDLRPSRSATAPRAQWRTQTQRDHVGGGSEQNKRPLMRKWEVVAPS